MPRWVFDPATSCFSKKRGGGPTSSCRRPWCPGTRLDDLRAFPDNRLEPLGGDRRGQHSIRINDQYRICFVWKDGDAQQVEVVDYH